MHIAFKLMVHCHFLLKSLTLSLAHTEIQNLDEKDHIYAK